LREIVARYADKLIGVSSRNGISQIFTLKAENFTGEESP
jgi:chromosome segregation ATPase